VEAKLARAWANLSGRIGGPLTFRLIVQPTVAAIFAIRAGVKDFREGRVPYGWAILSDPLPYLPPRGSANRIARHWLRAREARP